MSDEVKIAIISNLFMFLTVTLSRLMSRNEHRKTAADVNALKIKLNGCTVEEDL